MKKLIHRQRSNTPHWVGDGFPVRSIFTYNDLGRLISPFLLMDYGGPAEFTPTTERRGVGEHPQGGFETVTIVYAGEVEHRDSAGGGGIIRPGDVQWMTAASGVVHEESHGPDYAKSGGAFEMVQLWVNLPKKDKMASPRYQGISYTQIPVVPFPEGAGQLRVIAGQYLDAKGPALTFSPINLWDIQLKAHKPTDFEVPEGHTTTVFVMSGEVRIEDGKSTEGPTLEEAEIGVLESEGTRLRLQATKDAKVLLMGGEPLGEPIVGYGPFVMNSQAEIKQAFLDYENGLMGQLVPQNEGRASPLSRPFQKP